jgi:hypothetical protein
MVEKVIVVNISSNYEKNIINSDYVELFARKDETVKKYAA